MSNENVDSLLETMETWINVALPLETPVKKKTVAGKCFPLEFAYKPSPEKQDRDIAVRLLTNVIGDRENCTQIASAIEQSVFQDFYYSNRALYASKISSLVSDLNRNADNLLEQFEPHMLHLLTAEKRAVGTELEKKRNHQRTLYEQTLQPAAKRTDEGLFECPKCHTKNTHHTEKQTRSADEAATIFIHCFDCGGDFRQ